MIRFINALFILVTSLFYGCASETDEVPPDSKQLHFIDSAITPLDSIGVLPQIKAEIQVKRAIAFRNSLPSDLLAWTIQNPNLYSIIVNEFIADYTARNEFIAYNMIWSMTYNDNYSEDYFIADNDESNVAYTGPTVFIPDIINTDDGNFVMINFGDTYSDGQNADKTVSSLLIDALKTALKKANTILVPKISSIEIKSTTNGAHALTSNHYNRTALDITKINGQKIASIGLDNVVYELQKAFDQSLRIRENFGPFFKHKTYINGSGNNNYAIPGCFDHIHISVQSH